MKIEELEILTPEVENQIIENFGNQFLEDAMRIVQTRGYTILDGPIIHEAMCIVVAMYIRKLKTGEINTDRVIH